MPLHVAQLSDTHVVTDDTDEVLYVDNNGRAAAAVASIAAEQPSVSAVVATGDLTQWGKEAEYDRLADIIAPLAVPFLPVPGNHDTRDGLRRCFPDHPWPDGAAGAHLSWVTEIDDLRIIGLDTTIPGESGAEFDDERAAWLNSVLASPHDGPTLLAMHHPPFWSGIEWMDRGGFIGLERFLQVVASSPGAVDRIMCGHLHRPMSSSVSGVVAEVGVSTTVHVALDLAVDAPVRVVRDPVGYRILRIEDRSIVAHTRYVDTDEEPFEPEWAAGAS